MRGGRRQGAARPADVAAGRAAGASVGAAAGPATASAAGAVGFAPVLALMAALALSGIAPRAEAAGIGQLAANCLVCHPARPASLQGLDRPLVPLADLGRLPPDRIEAALRAFRANAGAGTVMPRIARALDDDEIAALARAFGRSGVPAAPAPVSR